MTGSDHPPDGDVPFSARLWRDARGIVLEVGGEVDLNTAVRFQAALLHAVADGPSVLVADLTAVTFLSSAAWSYLVSAHAMAGDGVLRVVASPLTQRKIRLIGLDEVLTLCPTVDDALGG